MRPLPAILCLSLSAIVAGAQDAPPLPTPDESVKSYAAHIAAAEYALRLDEPAAMLRWLDGAPAKQRGFEWHMLRAQADASERVIGRSEGTIFALATSADGRLSACAGGDTTIRVFRITDGEPTARLQGHTGEVYALAFSPGGNELASCGRDGTVRVWSLADNTERANVAAHKYPAASLAWSKDGKWIASTSYDVDKDKGVRGDIAIWNAKDLSEHARLTQEVKPLVACDFSDDCKQLLVGDWNDGATLWDIEKREAIQRFEGGGGQVHGVDINSAGTLLALACKDHSARVYDISGTLKATCKGHHDELISARFSPDGESIATVSLDGTLRQWALDGTCVAVLRGHARAPRKVEYLLDGRMVSGGIDRELKLWPAKTAGVDPAPEDFAPAVYATCFSPDGRLLALTGGDTVEIRQAATNRLLAAIKAGSRNNMTAHFDAAGARILACNADGTSRVISAYTGKIMAELKGHKAAVVGGGFLADGNVITASYDGTARTWNATTGEPLLELKGHTAGLNWLDVAADGRIATCARDGTIRLWTADGKGLAVLKGHRGGVNSVSWSRDGKRLASGGEDASVRIWEAATGAELALLRGHDSAVYRVAFSHSGTRIASGSTVLKLWDAATGECLLTRKPLQDALWCLQFAPGDTTLAVGSWNGTFALLHATSIGERAKSAEAAATAATWARDWLKQNGGDNPDADALAVKVAGNEALTPSQRAAVLHEILAHS